MPRPWAIIAASGFVWAAAVAVLWITFVSLGCLAELARGS